METWNRLLDRAFGGEDVAAAPGDVGDDFWPVAPAPANADFVVDRIVEKAGQPSSSAAREWVFLVGSAGNGKSALAKRLSSHFEACTKNASVGSLARRSYDYKSLSGVAVRIVNDATIPPERDRTLADRKYLLQDLSHAVEKNAFLLVCINRGILLQERRAIAAASGSAGVIDKRLGDEVISWVLGDRKKGEGRLEIVDPAGCGYYKFARLIIEPGHTIGIHVVYLDQVSLLEPAIDHASSAAIPWGQDGVLKPAAYKVGQFPDISGKVRSRSPAAILVDGLVERLEEPVSEVRHQSPLQANLVFFKSVPCRTGWMNMLRAAEISTGKLLTYREIWGLAVLGLVGFNRGEFRMIGPDGKPSGPGGWVESRLRKLDKLQGMKRLHVLLELASTRVHMATFGHDMPRDRLFSGLSKKAPPVFPTVRTMMSVDPVLDSAPADRVTREVNEAMRAISLDKRPSEFLIDSLKEMDGPEHPFLYAWQPFDEELEEAVLEQIHEHGMDSTSRALQAWLARYLSRLCNLSIGKPAFAEVVRSLHSSWERASKNHSLEDSLDAGLLALINGKVGSQADFKTPHILLPLLAPKAEPLVEDPLEPMLAVKVPTQLQLVPRTDGDQVVLDVKLHDMRVTSLVLDFDLCREALVFSGQGGFTERSHLAAPRIERVRAALLSEAVTSRMQASAGQSPELVAVKGDVRQPIIF